jgi:hypothetical protein
LIEARHILRFDRRTLALAGESAPTGSAAGLDDGITAVRH